MLSLNSDRNPSWRWIAPTYRVGQQAKVRETLLSLLDRSAGAESVFTGGQAAADAEDHATAETLFSSIRQTYPDPTKVGYYLALAQYRAQRFADSQKSLLELIRAGRETAQVYDLLGWCYNKQDDHEDCVSAFQRAIAIDPLNEASYVDLGLILLDYKRYAAAYGVAQTAAKALPNSYKIFLLKGMTEIRVMYYTDAVGSHARAVALNPQAPDADVGLAVSLWAAGDTRKALATFEEGLRRFPRDAFHYQEYGRFLLKGNMGDAAVEARAVALWQKAVALDGSRPEPHYLLGDLALRRGHTEEAVRQLEQAAKLDPQGSKERFALFRVYRRLGRKEEAARELALFQRLKAEETKHPATSLLSGTEQE